jgi:hypothetical protein
VIGLGAVVAAGAQLAPAMMHWPGHSAVA